VRGRTFTVRSATGTVLGTVEGLLTTVRLPTMLTQPMTQAPEMAATHHLRISSDETLVVPNVWVVDETGEEYVALGIVEITPEFNGRQQVWDVRRAAPQEQW